MLRIYRDPQQGEHNIIGEFISTNSVCNESYINKHNFGLSVLYIVWMRTNII